MNITHIGIFTVTYFFTHLFLFMISYKLSLKDLIDIIKEAF